MSFLDALALAFFLALIAGTVIVAVSLA